MVTQRERTQNGAKECIKAVREIRHFARGKPMAVQHAATTVIYHLISIARGRSSPQLYAALGENIKRMGGK